MHFSTVTSISLLGFAIHASAAALHTREINSGFWQISAKPPGDSSAIGIPLILGTDPTNTPTRLSTGAADEVPVCVQLLDIVDAQGVHYAGAKIINHPGITEDLFMWKTYGAKYLMSSTRLNIAGTRGDWTFVQDPSSTDLLLSLNGDTVAKQTEYGVHFGSDIPVAEGGVLISLVGVEVEAC
ncbi:hypothetical protein Q9L58_005865 [Maublancomyces gigas]|uniref:Uncharacterized protein n=1 Tax=Discina gigas TaxID=1032678 RepID=A0ABR3GGY4_9PEZI